MPMCAGRAVAPLEAHQAAKSASPPPPWPRRERPGSARREGKVVHGVRVPEGQFITHTIDT